MIPAPEARNPAVGGLEIPNAALTLRSGSLVHARVVQALGGGRWSVSVDGRLMTARSTLPLVPGQVLTTRVARNANTLFLRLDKHSSVSEFLRANHLSTDALTRHVVEALMRAGLPLDAAQIRRMRALLARSSAGTGSAERARLLAIAAAKKLEVGPEALEELVQYGGDRRHGEQHPGGHSRDDRRPRHDADSEEQIVRNAVTRSSKTPDHPAQLFNHAPGPNDDHWIVIPISYFADDRRYDASLRLCLSRDRQTVQRGALVVHSDRDRWGFEWKMPDGKPAQLTLHPAEGTPPRFERELERLEQQMRKFGVASLLIGEKATVFDGFSSELPMDIMSSIQEDA